MDYKLSPSDLTYLYEDCKRCFVLKVKYGVGRPSIPLPQIFARISTLQKDYYAGRRTDEFCKELPPGVVNYGENWVQSQVISLPDRVNGCYLLGRFDIVVEFDQGGFGIIDFKTREEGEEPTAMYGRQLHAYAYALENADSERGDVLGLSPVTRLGLLYFAPSACELRGARQFVSGPLTWVEVNRDDEAFMNFLGEVVDLLDSGLPEPQLCGRCAWCGQGNKCKAARGTPWQKEPCTCCHWCLYSSGLSKTLSEGVTPHD